MQRKKGYFFLPLFGLQRILSFEVAFVHVLPLNISPKPLVYTICELMFLYDQILKLANNQQGRNQDNIQKDAPKLQTS